MRALVQRVSRAHVTTNSEIVGSIAEGLVVFIGITHKDTEVDARYIVDKVTQLRILDNEQGKFTYSPVNVNAELLIISQFTLYADTRKGRRPNFSEAAEPGKAETMFDITVSLFKKTGLKVESGHFGAHMNVSMENDGPVSIVLDSKNNQSTHGKLTNEFDNTRNVHG